MKSDGLTNQIAFYCLIVLRWLYYYLHAINNSGHARTQDFYRACCPNTWPFFPSKSKPKSKLRKAQNRNDGRTEQAPWLRHHGWKQNKTSIQWTPDSQVYLSNKKKNLAKNDFWKKTLRKFFLKNNSFWKKIWK